MKIYKRSVYEDQGYAISFGTEEDLNDWKQEEKDWIAQDFSVADDTIEQIGVSTDKNIGAIEINNINKELGFDGIAYHYVIRRDGRLQRGRPVNKKGEHVVDATIEKESIGIILVGGLNCSSGDPNPTSFRSSQSFTISQYDTLEKFLTAFYRKYPGGKVFGHNDIDPTGMGKMINKSLKEKLEVNAMDLRLLKERMGRLPL